MNFYRFLADLVVAVHFTYVAFVVVGMAAILIGFALRWSWVRNFWFRAIHLLLIGIVVVESIFGVVCPLTTWENRLRDAGGEVTEDGSFIGRWVHDLLFIDASPWVLTTCYILFGLAVLATFIFAPPRRPRWMRKSK
jgi:hypothetical protein